MTDVAVYSAHYGRYDRVRPLPDLGVPAVMYTDDPQLDAPGWQLRVMRHGIATRRGRPATTAPMLAHKWWKTHPELAVPDVDVSLWLDASMEVTTPHYVKLCLEALGDDDWAMVRHPARDCVYPEATFSATLTWRYDTDSIVRQLEWYRQIGFPPGRGLMATGCNARRHTPQVLEVSARWWDECINWSHQDQISLPVLLWLEERAGHPLKHNYNIPWFQWWTLHEHGA